MMSALKRKHISNPAVPCLTSDAPDDKNESRLISGPFFIVEPGPDVFVTLDCPLRVQRLRVVKSQSVRRGTLSVEPPHL